MNVKKRIRRSRCGKLGGFYCLAMAHHIENPFFSFLDKTKISKQSALAVSQYLRDNQHQSTGMFRYALA